MTEFQPEPDQLIYYYPGDFPNTTTVIRQYKNGQQTASYNCNDEDLDTFIESIDTTDLVPIEEAIISSYSFELKRWQKVTINYVSGDITITEIQV